MATKAVKIKPKKKLKIKLTQLSLFEVIAAFQENKSLKNSQIKKTTEKNQYSLFDSKGTFFL